MDYSIILPFEPIFMKYSKYPLVASDDYHVYSFFSDGPKGKIRKGVFYTQIGKN